MLKNSLKLSNLLIHPFTISQEKDFTKFMRDPFNPMSDGETIDPELDWAGLKGSEHLLHLTDDTFDDAIAESDSVMVMFYAPCK